MGPLLFVGDAHLTRDDPEVDAFVAFLGREARRASALCIVGDLFNIWFGKPRFALPHHARVLGALDELRGRGVRLLYVEGNRDFHLRRNHLGRPFDDVAEDSLVVEHAGRRIAAAHGDAVNAADWQYRAWKAFSKSTPVYGAFSMLPGSWGMALGESLERRLAGTNLRHKSRFPEEHCRAYAARFFAEGSEALVLGHFHEERRLDVGGAGGAARAVYVLPAWRLGHRHLVVEEAGPPRFEKASS